MPKVAGHVSPKGPFGAKEPLIIGLFCPKRAFRRKMTYEDKALYAFYTSLYVKLASDWSTACSCPGYSTCSTLQVHLFLLSVFPYIRTQTVSTARLSEMNRRTQVPICMRFHFSEENYALDLATYERERVEFDDRTPHVENPVEPHVNTRRSLVRMFTHASCMDSLRYDFIQHYIAYHRSKIRELNEVTPFRLGEPYIISTMLCEQLRFYHQQAALLQEVLVQRAGHCPHAHKPFHSVGQRFYNDVNGNVASVYEADRADRQDIAIHGQYAHGHRGKIWRDCLPELQGVEDS